MIWLGVDVNYGTLVLYVKVPPIISVGRTPPILWGDKAE